MIKPKKKPPRFQNGFDKTLGYLSAPLMQWMWMSWRAYYYPTFGAKKDQRPTMRLDRSQKQTKNTWIYMWILPKTNFKFHCLKIVHHFFTTKLASELLNHKHSVVCFSWTYFNATILGLCCNVVSNGWSEHLNLWSCVTVLVLIHVFFTNMLLVCNALDVTQFGLVASNSSMCRCGTNKLGLLCSWAYVSCHVTQMQRLKQKVQSKRTFFENEEMAVTLPTAALPGCGLGYTSVRHKR